MDFGGHHQGRIARLLQHGNARMQANTGDAIPERMRAAGLADAVQVGHRGGVGYFRAAR
jgi:hypothetical protein